MRHGTRHVAFWPAEAFQQGRLKLKASHRDLGGNDYSSQLEYVLKANTIRTQCQAARVARDAGNRIKFEHHRSTVAERFRRRPRAHEKGKKKERRTKLNKRSPSPSCAAVR